MFTGIITDIGEVARRDGGRFAIRCGYAPETIAIGTSIACDGACLTAVEVAPAGSSGSIFTVDVSNETLGRTALGEWQPGRRVNLERALKAGDELGGHIVAGHADGIATIVKRDDLPDMARFELQTTRELARFIATKGSVTLDGVSLTVNTVDEVMFSVLIIPHTLEVTTLSGWRAGGEVNIEVDLMARYAARLSEME
jgi:riboflavin synthase